MTNRKVIHTITRRYLWQNRNRTLISLLGILLMTLLMTCVFVGKDTLLTHLTRSAEAEYGKWDVVGYRLSEKAYQTLLEEVSSDEFALTTDDYYSDLVATGNPDHPFISLRRYSSSAFDWHSVKVTSGRLPEKEGEIVLSQAVPDEGSKLALGDSIEARTFKRYLDNQSDGELVFPFLNLTLPAKTKTELPRNFAYFGNDPTFPKDYVETHEGTGFTGHYTIVGFIEPPLDEQGAAYTAVAYLDDKVFPSQDVMVNVSLNLEDIAQVPMWRDRLKELGAETVESNNEALSLAGVSTDATLNSLVIFAQVFFTLLIGGVSILLIYNLFNLSYEERLRYLSLLTSVGATSEQRRASVYYEAFLLLVIALPFGLFLGFGVIYWALHIIAPYLLRLFSVETGVTLTLVVTWQSLLWILIATALTVFVAAYLPARKIAKQVPMEGLRSTFSTKRKGRRAAVSFSSHAEGILVKGFLRHQKAKGNSIVRALAAFVAILLITGYGAQAILSAVHYKLIQSSTFNFPNRGDWDYHLSGHGNGVALTSQLVEELKQTEGVEAIDQINYSMFSGQLKAEAMSDAFHQAVYAVTKEFYDDDWTYEDYWQQYPAEGHPYFLSLVSFDDEVFETIVEAVGGNWDKSKAYPIVLYQNGEVSTTSHNVWQKTARHYRFFEVNQMVKAGLGEELTADFVTESTEEKAIQEAVQFSVAGVGDRDTLAPWLSIHDGNVWAIMPQSAFETLDQATNHHLQYEQSIAFNVDETNPVAMSRVHDLQQLQTDGVQLFKGEIVGVENYVTSLATVIQIMMISFAVLASLICVLNVYNTVIGLIVTRRQQFVILRSLGMTRQQLASMIRREFYVLFVKSLLVGLPLAGLACWGLNWGVVQRFGYFKVTLPGYVWLSLVICYGLVLMLVQLLIMRESQRSLIDAIRRETV